MHNCPLYKTDVQTALQSTPRLSTLCGKRVMVVGAAGLIGSFLVDMLLAFNCAAQEAVHIIAVDRDAERLERRFGHTASAHLSLVAQDICTPLTTTMAADFVIHAASNAYPAAFAADPVGTVMSNILGTYHLLDFAQKSGAKRFLFVSSGEVYGQGTPTADGFAETDSGYVDSMAVRSCYPSSKRAAETLCVSFAQQYGLDTVVVRPCHTYGPNATAQDNRANVQFVNKAILGENIVMTSRGTQQRSYCYIADCASAILTVLLGGKSGEAYNIANPTAKATVAEFAQTVAKEAGVQVLFKEADITEKAQQTVISYAVLSAQKLCALGWQGRYTVEEGIRQTLSILRKTEG